MTEQKKVVDLSYNSVNKILKASWTIDFEDSVSVEDIKDGFRDYLRAVQDNEVRAVIMDFFSVRYPITEDLYNWAIDNLVKTSYEQGIVVFAYVAPDDPISRFGFDMYIQELILRLKKSDDDIAHLAGKVKRNIFQNIYQAEKWVRDRLLLLSDN